MYQDNILRSSSANLLKGPHNQIQHWVSLGTQDLFVGLQNRIVEDSFIDSTLNIGGSSTSFSAKITHQIVKLLSLGQEKIGFYNGFLLEKIVINLQTIFKIGTNSLLWDGTNLITSGSGEFSGNLAKLL